MSREDAKEGDQLQAGIETLIIQYLTLIQEPGKHSWKCYSRVLGDK